jgi:hypothetical protein
MRKRATKQQIAASIGLLAAVIGAGWFWWPHVRLRFQLARNEVRIPKVTVAGLQAPGRTAGWADCRIGPVSFKLPPELAEKAERSLDKTSIVFSATDRQFTVDVPYRIKPEVRSEHEKIAAEFGLTPIRLIVSSYRTGTDDFGWSMTHAELIRFQVLLRMAAGSYPHTNAMSVETRFDGGLEGVLIQGDRRTAIFHWQTASGNAFGVLVFLQKEGDLELDWVRDVCQNLTCDESRLGETEYSRKELREMLEAIEIKMEKAN